MLYCDNLSYVTQDKTCPHGQRTAQTHWYCDYVYYIMNNLCEGNLNISVFYNLNINIIPFTIAL